MLTEKEFKNSKKKQREDFINQFERINSNEFIAYIIVRPWRNGFRNFYEGNRIHNKNEDYYIITGKQLLSECRDVSNVKDIYQEVNLITIKEKILKPVQPFKIFEIIVNINDLDKNFSNKINNFIIKREVPVPDMHINYTVNDICDGKINIKLYNSFTYQYYDISLINVPHISNKYNYDLETQKEDLKNAILEYLDKDERRVNFIKSTQEEILI